MVIFMTTNKFPKSALSDSQATGSQSQPASSLNRGYLSAQDLVQDTVVSKEVAVSIEAVFSKEAIATNDERSQFSNDSNYDASYDSYDSNDAAFANSETFDTLIESISDDAQDQQYNTEQASSSNHNIARNDSYFDGGTNESAPVLSERVFMNGLVKHTGIALAIIIPLAAFSAYAAPASLTSAELTKQSSLANTSTKATNLSADKKNTAEKLNVKPSEILYQSATVPTTVERVDLDKYVGIWYEIGRLPMYFQRNCVSDVTANYVNKTDDSGIQVINKCKDDSAEYIVAEGLAKPADATGSKLKVTFLPSWIRWLPVGRADYWILARDPEYKTALVGTPDKDYLWLLARSPNISQETYAKYRQIAQQQSYDLKEFKLTPHSNQTVKLVP